MLTHQKLRALSLQMLPVTQVLVETLVVLSHQVVVAAVVVEEVEVLEEVEIVAIICLTHHQALSLVQTQTTP